TQSSSRSPDLSLERVNAIQDGSRIRPVKYRKPAQHKHCGLFCVYCRLVRIAESLTGIDVK
ncbi:hypothetical protein, partial [Salmonella enterica]|uniref:hypothetical protein n=1 Tax=Salmonella enterica TaxID=28901 RepID=UPI001C37C777